MKTTIKHILPCIFLVLACALGSLAQNNIYIVKTTDTSAIDTARSVDSLTFSGTDMNVYSQGVAAAYDAASIKKAGTSPNINKMLPYATPSVHQQLDFTISPTWDGSTNASIPETVVTDVSQEDYNDFVENSTWNRQVFIAYQGTSATVSGKVEGLDITTTGAHVVVKAGEVEGVAYVLSGNTGNGSMKLYGSKKAQIKLQGVSITNPQGPALNVQSKKRTFVVMADKTLNSLYDGATYAAKGQEDQKGCIFCEGQLLLSGSGHLMVAASHKNGIASDEYIRISGGNIKVSTTATKGVALKAKENVIIGGGAIELLSQGIASKSINSDSLVTITGGKLTSICSGGAVYDEADQDYSACSGVKADKEILISGGMLSLLSTNTGGKGINAGGSLTIEGGQIDVITTGMRIQDAKGSSSPKAIKSGQDLTVNGGVIRISGSSSDGAEGLESKHYLTVNGGSVIAVGLDDGMNASDGIRIHGGDVFVSACGNDGIDSNGYINITGGNIFTISTAEKQAGIDNDGKTFSIEGGIFVSIGESASMPQERVCKQPVVRCDMTLPAPYVTVQDSNGKDVLSFQTSHHTPMTILFSSPALQVGSSYAIQAVTSMESGLENCGILTNPVWGKYTLQTTFPIASMLTQIK